jgi:hypothetical protein
MLHSGTTATPPGTFVDWGRLACASNGKVTRMTSKQVRNVVAIIGCMVLTVLG